jgi:hypothetical protein
LNFPPILLLLREHVGVSHMGLSTRGRMGMHEFSVLTLNLGVDITTRLIRGRKGVLFPGVWGSKFRSRSYIGSDLEHLSQT